MSKGELHKIGLERLEYLMDKEENLSINENETNEILYLMMYCDLFENKYFPIDLISLN